MKERRREKPPTSSMAANWVKSLHCKSRAFEDVVHNPTPRPIKPKHLLSTTSCRNNTLKDVIIDKPIIKPDPASHPHKPPVPRRPESVKAKPDPIPTTRVSRRTLAAPINPVPDDLPFFPSVSDLPEGHTSRNVVEIIFRTRWGPKPFSGRVEMVFKIQNPAPDLARFEEYRATVKLRANSDDGGRCSADGNEMMRFRCLGAAASSGDCGWFLSSAKKGVGAAVCTYSGSGKAHECGGGGRGKRAMLLCRVIAGRVAKRIGLEKVLDGSVRNEYDSVKGEDGELAVFDSRAVLPCFLVIYKF